LDDMREDEEPKPGFMDSESAQLKSKSSLRPQKGPAGENLTAVEPEMENVNSRTVQLVKLLTEVGPDVPEISRRLGQFKESVRYRYKEKILNRGFAVQGAVDHEKLGLKRLILIADVPDPYRVYAQSILLALHELCYVVGFTKTLVGGEHVINLSVPAEHVDKTRSFWGELKEKGLFSKLEILDYDWARVVPMKPDNYDFDTGRWDFDWQFGGSGDYKSAAYVPSTLAKFDEIDLLLIKELQIDANKSIKEIADKLGVNYKKLAWHHVTHVLDRKLLSGYTVNWMGTKYDYNLEKALHRKHRYFIVDVFVRNVTELESMTLRSNIAKLPFIWGEAGGPNYFAELALPIDSVVEGLQYLGNATRPVVDRTSIFPIDQTEAARFTVPYQLYDSASRKWKLDPQDLMARFDRLMVQIKAGVS
jgi:hypothetical protein